jgi:o-succinylbenzoate synthase
MLNMKIDGITLRELRMRLKAPFETSFGVMQERRILLVEMYADGVTGWGEITAVESPSYNSETTDTAWHIVSDFVAPAILGRTIDRASELEGVLGEVRGNYMAKAGVENAVWDIEAQQQGLPLWKLIGGSRDEISCGVSIGIRPDSRLLVNTVEQELASGYQRIKLKIKPGKDMDFVAAVRNSFPKILLSVDANSAYRPEDASHLQQLDQFQLLMIEQPLAWDDIYSHVRLQSQLRTALCLDECINNDAHALAAIESGACKIINIKLGRVGGYAGARKVHDICRKHNIPVWCGGMLESGIGRAHNIALSTLPGFTLPGDVSASRRYWDEDIIEPEVEVSRQGTIKAPAAPGLGFKVRKDRLQCRTVRERIWRSSTQIAC